MRRNTMKGQRGITLIALVITIIVLLILAGVAISMLSGENGILKQAVEAKEKTEESQKDEETNLNDMEVTIDLQLDGTPYKFKNGYLTGINIEDWEKVGELKLPNKYYVFTSKGDIIKGKNITNVATGMIIKKGDTEELAKSSKVLGTIIVYGDLDGDGIITTADSISNVKEKDISKIAADVNHDGLINQIDSNIIVGCIAGRNTIKQDLYAQKTNEILIQTPVVIRENYIEALSPKFTVEYIQVGKKKEYVLTNATSETTVKEILDLLPENAAIYREDGESYDLFTQGLDGNDTARVQADDEIWVLYDMGKDESGEVTFEDYTLLFYIAIK